MESRQILVPTCREERFDEKRSISVDIQFSTFSFTVCNYVRECSDYGEIVITDIEENGTRRLYEILMDYPKDKWYEYRKWLYCYIRQELMFLFV